MIDIIEILIMAFTFTGVYIVLVFLILRLRQATFRSKREEKKSISKFYETLDKMFDSPLVIDQFDIEILKSAIEREADTVYSLAPLLEDYLLYLGERGSQESELSQRYQVIKAIIKSEKAEKPFADIPKEERRLLIAMHDAIQHVDKNSMTSNSMTFNLNELSSVISTRSREHERAINANRWMRPLTIIALGISAISVFFGILGFLH